MKYRVVAAFWRVACVLALGCPVRAFAQSDAYCRHVEARAAADAALLMAPRLTVEGGRFPAHGGAEFDAMAATASQLRVGLTFSVSDVYRGVLRQQIAGMDCAVQENARAIDQLLQAGEETPALPALRAQVAFLDGQRAQWQAIIEKAEERLQARTLTTLELADLRRLVRGLELKREQLRGDWERLQARAVDVPSASPDELANRLVTRSLALEQHESELRGFGAWSLRLSGGVIPAPEREQDWFARAELSYSLGGAIAASQGRAAIDARRDELRTARYSLPSRLRDYARELRRRAEQTRRELAILDGELGYLDRTLQAVVSADSGPMSHTRDALLLERFSVASDRVYLQTLLDTLLRWTVDSHGTRKRL